ncbi:MAG: lysophospholipid acyltransferase family protein [Holosporaceae bacterium]|nr:lysophospholipid acyltransferase family protein [Holosporaceae bacterium]
MNSNPYVFLKKLKNHRKFEAVVSKIMAFLMRLSFYTTKWTVIGEEIPESYHQKKVPFIVCLWHDRLMLAPCVWKWKKPLHVLASSHSDGRLIAKIVKKFSMPPIYGSTGKGFTAVKKIIQLVKSGEYVAIIPDGPRGPRHKLAPGAVTISKFTKADILPFSFCVKRYFLFNSWDKFIWAWPFNRGVMVWGSPITAAKLKSMSSEEALDYVESQINAASHKAMETLINV